jgi:serine/threonine protein kinase
MKFAPGLTVAGRYRLLRMVGAGGMGEVWAGDDTQSKRRVALKRLLPAAAKHHEVITRFKREAFFLGKIQSPYVARVIDFLDDDTFGLVIVMEFIEGPSLAHALDERNFSIEEAITVAGDVLRALVDLHGAKIVHRDLKPGNIILAKTPSGVQRAMIVDFGISRLLTSEGDAEVTGITRANIALGTVEYMAPEQILNSRDVTPVTDLYAVGIILFRAVRGHHAFGERRGEELARAKLVEDAPALDVGRTDAVAIGFYSLVARALKKRPAQRFQSAQEMLIEVERLQSLLRQGYELDETTTDGVKVSDASLVGVTTADEAPAVPTIMLSAIEDDTSLEGRDSADAPGRSPSSASPSSGSHPAASPSAALASSSASSSSAPSPLPASSAPMTVPSSPATPIVPSSTGVSRGFVGLAALTAFALGAAIGIVAGPARTGSAPAASCPPATAALGLPGATSVAAVDRAAPALAPSAAAVALPTSEPTAIALDLDAPPVASPTAGKPPPAARPVGAASASLAPAPGPLGTSSAAAKAGASPSPKPSSAPPPASTAVSESASPTPGALSPQPTSAPATVSPPKPEGAPPPAAPPPPSPAPAPADK